MFLNQKVVYLITFLNGPEFEKKMAKIIYRFEKTKSFFLFFKRFYLFILTEGKEGDREGNINV